MAQLEEAWAVNHVVGKLSPGCAKLTKRLQQAFDPKLLGLSYRDLNLEAPVYPNIFVDALKVPLCPSHIEQVCTAAWCCQPECVAQCIPLEYTDSFRSGRY